MLTLEALFLRQGDCELKADLEVPKGITALIGPSGGGKSTLLAGIAGFLRQVSGRISFADEDLTDLDPGQRPVSILFQDHNLFPHLTIGQNTGLALRPNLRLEDKEWARVYESLDRVGLAGMSGRKPGSLSGGQQSRAALARVLLADRPVVLLDEPFAALGPGLRVEMLDLLARTMDRSDKTIVMVTHDPSDAQRVADHVMFLDAGQVQPPQPTAKIFADPPEALRVYLGQMD